jgi:hypothetical protein
LATNGQEQEEVPRQNDVLVDELSFYFWLANMTFQQRRLMHLLSDLLLNNEGVVMICLDLTPY